MTFNVDAGKDWLKCNIHNHLASNARNYKTGVMTLKLGTNMLGYSVDLKPFEGVVLHCDPSFIVVKTGRTEFKVVDPTILSEIPDVNSKVLITPYSRRRFDGSFLRDPIARREDAGDGRTVIINTYEIGTCHSTLPVGKPTGSYKEYMSNMLTLLTHGKCNDGVRVISNMLVDFNAAKVEMILPPDMDEETGESLGPWVDAQIAFDCKTDKFVGRATIGLDMGADTYYVVLQKPDENGNLVEHTRCSTVYFDQMATVLENLLCDGKWKIAKVEVLKKAPKAAASKTSVVL